MTKAVCQAAIDIIKQAEGLRLTAYRCSAGKPSIGFGSTKGVTESDIGKRTITEAEAERRLVEDVAYAADQVDKAVTVPLTDNQRGALISLVYNTGPGAKGVKSGIIVLKEGGPSTLLRRLNDRNYAAAAAEFDKWVFAGGKKLAGLITRRAAEKALFLTPDNEVVPVPEPVPTPAPTLTPAVSRVGSGAAVSALAGAPAAWIIAAVWNAVLPQSPMPIEVAMAVGSGISTGLYLLVDWLSREKQPSL